MAGQYLEPTRILDFTDPTIAGLVAQRGWNALDPSDRVGAVYEFVRDEIPFGYNVSDDIPASRVLADGYGQCNTKTTLLIALLRATGIECRFHGATIDKALQRGVMVGLLYRLAPRSIIHSWAEVNLGGRWLGLEGVILDLDYLAGLRVHTNCSGGAFLGYGVGTDDLASPCIQWRGSDTRIQATGINRDFGVFDDPDSFYRSHGANARGVKGWLYGRVMRNAMNKRVGLIRAARLTTDQARSAGKAAAPSNRLDN